ncbi:ribbon-helix-helix protein, CopG family [Sphingomonas gilva]|uniref:Ribbon-helix-helix protein, CopG family n=1 Tax=Sphingomonas gilva TaxID=2305907 RepID=A0A396S0B9_9SPHN|nr:ribbon-helix-helix protein, CopG family [Sphingomonas gilva]RHW16775.1 ribbon-helix-helix protein, CopG family [Sphingomonas gilva]
MSQTTVITARISNEASAQLDRLAAELDRSRAWVIATAVERYVREELEFIDFIKEGEEDIAAGRYITHDELLAEIAARRTRSKRAA